MADYPLSQLGGKTPLQSARTPNLDFLARKGKLGRVGTIPQGMSPGSDIANLNILGYNPKQYFTGRGPLEAVNFRIPLKEKDIVYRCNLVTVRDDILVDYSGGRIPSHEAKVLIDFLNEKLSDQNIRFYSGVSYRHLMVWKNGRIVKCVPPHDIAGKSFPDYLPSGKEGALLRDLMFASRQLLEKHEINQVRRELGEDPANMIWFWGGGRRMNLPSFREKYGLEGAVISAVDLVKGIGAGAGLDVIEVPGATGYLNTNYLGKARAALKVLQKKDFVWVHVEAPDEASHEGNVVAKIRAIEDFDQKVVGYLQERLAGLPSYRILVLTDHFTPISLKTHSSEPVPFAIYDSSHPRDGGNSFDELEAKKTGWLIKKGYELMPFFLGQMKTGRRKFFHFQFWHNLGKRAVFGG